MFYVYILESEKNGTYYIGQTDDLNARLKRHNSGRQKYTKPHRPWKLIFSKEVHERKEAMELEKLLKSKKRRELIITFAQDLGFTAHP